MIARIRISLGSTLLEPIDIVADFGACPVLGADEFAADDSLAIDDVGLGPHVAVVEAGGFLGGIVHSDQVDVAHGDEVPVHLGIFIDAHSQDDQIGLVVMELEEGRHLHDAGGAPGGPEVQQDDLAAIAGEVDGGGSVGDGKVGGHVAGLGGMRAAVAGGDEGQRQENQGCE